jgi:hypothetical protein
MCETVREVNGCRANENIPVLCNVTNSDINFSNTHEFVNRELDQCHGNVLNDLILPKFADCHKQNVVHFLAELDSYFNDDLNKFVCPWS